jgi:hypothetical protein
MKNREIKFRVWDTAQGIHVGWGSRFQNERKTDNREIKHDYWSNILGDVCYCKSCCDDRDNGRCH